MCLRRIAENPREQKGFRDVGRRPIPRGEHAAWGRILSLCDDVLYPSHHRVRRVYRISTSTRGVREDPTIPESVRRGWRTTMLFAVCRGVSAVVDLHDAIGLMGSRYSVQA